MPEKITLPSGTSAVSARPADGREPVRGVVLIPDIGGLRPLFGDLCQKLADDHGWAVVAPEPWPGREDLDLETKLASVDLLHDPDVLADLRAAADASGAETVAVIGFCMGGMFALKAAADGRFDKAVPFYGMIRMPEHWRNDDSVEPIDAVRADGACPVLAIVGTDDPYTPPDDVDDLEATGARVIRYAGAEHGFVHDPSRPAHRADYAADAWRRVVTWLDG